MILIVSDNVRTIEAVVGYSLTQAATVPDVGAVWRVAVTEPKLSDFISVKLKQSLTIHLPDRSRPT
jgi:hypothetical protein